MAIYEHTSQTITYNQPVLVFPNTVGAIINGSVPSAITIPLLLTSYNPVGRKSKTQTVTGVPILTANHSYGGSVQAEGSLELPKLSLEGTIDSPIKSAPNVTR